MPRSARQVVPGFPHHIVQRGNRRQTIFFTDQDRRAYLRWLAEATRACGVDVWAYCLMTNHVHLVAVPARLDSLARCLGVVNTKYAIRINRRKGWSGHLWQGRFKSSVMDASHAVAAVRYVEQNPVRARLVQQAWEYPWSSARHHTRDRDRDIVVRGDESLRAMVPDWRTFLRVRTPATLKAVFLKNTEACRAIGAPIFLKQLASEYGIHEQRRPAGRPRKRQEKPGTVPD